jgi:hypothetical protein
MRRDQCIDMVYAEVMKHVPISREAYGNSLSGWDIEPVMAGYEVIGILLLHGHEIHLQIGKYKALRHMRQVIRQCAVRNLERLGYLTTRSDGDGQTVRFLRRLGFYETGIDGTLTVYRLDKLNIK